MGVKRIRIDFYDDSGCRHTISLQGPVTREKIGRILDYTELMGGLSSFASPSSARKYPWTKLDRVRDLVVHRLHEATASVEELRAPAYLGAKEQPVHFCPSTPRSPHLPMPLSTDWGATGIALVHRIPPVGLKCVSERRRREMAALVGG